MLEHRTRRDRQARPAAPGSPAGSTRCCRRQARRSCRRSRPARPRAPRQTARTGSPPAASADRAAQPPADAPAQAARDGRACRSASAAAAPAPQTQTAPCSPVAARPDARAAPMPRHARPPTPPRSPPAAGCQHTSSRTTTAACDTPACPQQLRLDLARLDPEPAKLHLPVRAADKLQHPVRHATAPSPRCGTSGCQPRQQPAMRVRNKPLRRQPKPTQIAPRQPRPRDVKLPNNPRRHRLQSTVQNVNPRVRDRTADRDLRTGLIAGHDVANGVDRGLRRAVEIADPPDLEMAQNLVLELYGERLATQRQMIQSQGVRYPAE